MLIIALSGKRAEQAARVEFFRPFGDLNLGKTQKEVIHLVALFPKNPGLFDAANRSTYFCVCR
jgi:hypothetical protein